MATGSTKNFCAQINTDLESDNELAIYCKENGNLTLLDPAGAIPNNSVNQEDLVIYATLKSKVRNKSLIENKIPERVIEINFLKAKLTSPGEAPDGTSFLTTNWTNIGSLDSQLGDDLESFGMTAIDINFNGGFMPIITIDFEDIRGATLFEQGSCSPYAGFFHQPYPIFELTIKGYYGYPVTYYLHCQKFTTSFDGSSGNYKSKGEFLGYSYAFLSDILLGYVMAAPYIEGYEEKLTNIYNSYLKYYQELGYNEGPNKFDPLAGNQGRPFTMFNFVKKLMDLVGQGNSDKGPIADIQNSIELDNIDKLDDLESVIGDILGLIDDFKEQWEEKGGKEETENVFTYGIGGAGSDDPRIKEITDVYDIFFGSVGSIKLRVELYNERLAQVNNASLTQMTASDFTLSKDSGSQLKLDLNTFINQANGKSAELTNTLNSLRTEFKQLANARIKASIGFIPTVRTFFTVLMANTELFLEILKEVSEEAEKYHLESDETFRYKGVDDVRVGGESGAVFAWPTYVEEKPNATKSGVSVVETYPGNNPKFTRWPEVIFVEKFLKALQEMMKDINQAENGETEAVDQYDDVPGRDNYFAINAMETPTGAVDCNNGYFNLNGADEILKSLGERFIILSNFSALNSNYLNTSIIASAKNKFLEFRNNKPLQGVNMVLPTTDLTTIFPFLEKANFANLNPFFSSGVPFNPPSWDGEDTSYSNSITFTKSKYKSIGGLRGYPYIDHNGINSSTPIPIGYKGSDKKYSNSGESDIISLIDSGGEVESLANTNINNLTVSSSLRTFYYKKSTNEVLSSSPCGNLMGEAGGDPDIFIISEPIYYTKTIIYFWAGMEKAISRDAQLAQIPTEIKDRCFIVLAAGTKGQSNQNTIQQLKDAFKSFYSKAGNTRKLATAGTDINFSTEFENYSNIFMGYSLGGYALFNNNITGAKLIGFVDPSISTNYSELTNQQKWNSNSRLIWGSSGMIGIFKESNYKSLNDTILAGSGKATKKNNLDHLLAIKEWFDLYKNDVLDPIKGISEQLLNTNITNTEKPVEKKIAEKKDIEKKKKNSNFGSVVIAEGTKKNWEFWGKVEAHNFYNSVENVTVIGNILSTTDNTEELHTKILSLLGITGNDVYVDEYNELYRYNQPLKLNRASAKSITLLPDIHQMRGDDLVKLVRFDDAITKGWNYQEDFSVGSAWYKTESKRSGFGLKKDNTLITSNVLKDYLGSRYGKYPTGEGILEAVEGYTKVRIVDLVADKDVPSKLNSDLNSTRTFSEGGIFLSEDGMWDANSGLGKDQLGAVMHTRFSQINWVILDKFLTVDIFPDQEFDYINWSNVFVGNKKYGDFNYRYAKSWYEFNNDSVRRIKQSSPSLPYHNWNVMDFAAYKTLDEYSVDLLKYSKGANSDNNPYTGIRWITKNAGNYFLLPYSTSYSNEISSFTKYRELISNLSSTQNSNSTSQYIQNLDTPIVPLANVASTTAVVNTALPNQILDNQFNALQNNNSTTVSNNLLNYSQNFNASLQNNLTSGGNLFSNLGGVLGQGGFFATYLNTQGTTSSTAATQTVFNDSDISLTNTTLINNFSPQGSINKSTGSSPTPYNSNFLNVGGSITETPFWRHNLPASENGSNVSKSYFSFFGGGYANYAESINYANPKAFKKPLYMGLKNDLDSWSDSSKYFPGGYIDPTNAFNNSTIGNIVIQNFSKFKIGKDGTKNGVKAMLTNHNQGTFSWIKNQSGTVIDDDAKTNYNRTKAWKGALAYLFLSNQLHKPWTGMYTNSLKDMSPQNFFGSGSATAKMPRHTVLLLGAVLWRMREKGLLKSDDPKWNMNPKLTVTDPEKESPVDPLNYPLMPKVINLDGIFYDTRNFVQSIGKANISDNEYPTNRGVKPPILSFASFINLSHNTNDIPVFCFPDADEWPVLNTGMIYAYDFFNDKGVQNPFTNQYKIWTPILGSSGTRALRYTNTNFRWQTSEKQAQELQDRVISTVEDLLSPRELKDYSDSAKASISQELAEYAQKHLESEFGKISKETIEQQVAANQELTPSEEGFTRFSTLIHYITDSFHNTSINNPVKNLTAQEIKDIIYRTSISEDGRNGLYYTDAGGTATASNQVTSLDQDFLDKNTKVIEIKTYTELNTLFNKLEYKNSSGTKVKITQILEEVATETSTNFEGKSVKQGEINIHLDGSGNYLIKYPLILEKNGYDTGYGNGSVKVVSLPSQDIYLGTSDKWRTYKTKEHIRQAAIQNGFNPNNWGDDIYRPIGYYNIFDNSNIQVYKITDFKKGRKFRVIETQKSVSTSNTSSQNVQGGNLLTQKIKLETTPYGYLRGYLPIGPEIWFMPTSVKEIFIKEFEDFVGDFNNFNDSSEFDFVLKTIDPLNFPKTQPDNKIAGVFEKELTYPLFFSEVGTKGTDAPFLLKPTSENDKLTYSSVQLDSNGLPKIPEALNRWVSFYSIDVGLKSTRLESTGDGANDFIAVETREQKTAAADVQTDGTPIRQIWNNLFGSFYMMTSLTPRIWWGEFPLRKESGGKLIEATNDYFRFSKQEMFSFLNGFVSEINGATIINDYKQKLKDYYNKELDSSALGGNQDDDLRLTIYRSLKAIYDKWISASPAGPQDNGRQKLFYDPIGEGRLLIDHFSFVNRVNQDIGDKALVDLETVSGLFQNIKNSIFGVSSDVLDTSNFNFFPLPGYVDLSAGVSLYSKKNTSDNTRVKMFRDMFRPLATQDYFSETLRRASGPHFLCQYVGGNSRELNLSNNKERGCLIENTKAYGKKEKNGDSFSVDPDRKQAPPDVSQFAEDSNGVIGFKVRFGSQTQSHFLGINLDQAEYKNTGESLVAIDKIANAATEGGSGGFIAKGQSLYEVFLNRSYSCTVEALGNMMIQPLQYFELENVPMFYGSYLITDVKHSVKPHNVKTTFTGSRVPYAVVPIVEDLISSFSLKPSQGGRKFSLKDGKYVDCGECYETVTRTITVGNGGNYIIGDSQSPFIDNASTKASLIGKNGNQGAEQYLWLGGQGLVWLKGAVDKYSVDNEAQSIIINIGTNGGFNASEDVNGLVTSIKTKFPNAKLYAVQGSWGWGGNKNITQEKVNAYYKKFSDLGVTLIEPPIGSVVDPHGNLPIYQQIGKALDDVLPNPKAGSGRTETITEKIKVPCKTSTPNSSNNGGNTTEISVSGPNDAVVSSSKGLFIKSGKGVYIVDASNGLGGVELRKFMTDFNSWIKTNYPSKDWELASNGVTRELAETVSGGPARDKGSWHGAGLAIDVQFLGTYGGKTLGNAYDSKDRPGKPRYGYSRTDGGSNQDVANEPEFLQAMYKFLNSVEPWKSRIKWGAEFFTRGGIRNAPGLTGPAGASNVALGEKVACVELHHFEFSADVAKTYWEPWKGVIEGFGLEFPPTTSLKREKLYRYALANPDSQSAGGATSSTASVGGSSAGSSVPCNDGGDGVSISSPTLGSSTEGDYGVTDGQLFFYLSHQQGAGGAAEHYSLWKRNGKIKKYDTYKGKNEPSMSVRIKSNWPGNRVAKNGVKKSDVDSLFNSDQTKLAEAFVDVWRQAYADKKKTGLDLINSSGKNRHGLAYSDIKSAFEKNQIPPGLDVDSLATFATIENSLCLDTADSSSYVGMFQFRREYYKETIAKFTTSSGHKSGFTLYGPVDTFCAVAIPEINKNFKSFVKVSGFA